MMSCVAMSNAHLVPDSELDHIVGTRIDGTRARQQLRTLLNRPGFAKGLETAYQYHGWVLKGYGQMLSPLTAGQHSPWYITEVDLDRRLQRTSFSFIGYIRVSVSSVTGQLVSASLNPPGQEVAPLQAEAASPIGSAKLEAVARDLAKLTNAFSSSAEYRLAKRESGDRMLFMFVGYLPSTDFELGPEFHVSFDRITGLPRNVSLKTDIPPYEPPFKSTMSDHQAMSLGLPLLAKHIDWASFRLIIGKPWFKVPEDDKAEAMSRRLSTLIAQNRRCLTTSVTALRLTGANNVVATWTFWFDSQTQEPLGSGGDVFGGRVETDVFDRNQMIASPALDLQVPVISAKSHGDPASEKLVRIIVRQGKMFFSAKLDQDTRVIWIEGKPYQATRAFSNALLKMFPQSR